MNAAPRRLLDLPAVCSAKRWSKEKKLTNKVKHILGATTAILLTLLVAIALIENFSTVGISTGKAKLLGQIGLSLLGLSMVEQIWRNSPSFGRSSIKYMCIGIATIFAFDFFMYADALLFGQVSDSFWNARGFVNALLTPLFAINVINTRKQPVDFQLSRSAFFMRAPWFSPAGTCFFWPLAVIT